jgi:hypothetical protein
LGVLAIFLSETYLVGDTEKDALKELYIAEVYTRVYNQLVKALPQMVKAASEDQRTRFEKTLRADRRTRATILACSH